MDIKVISIYLRIITGILAVANIVYGIMGYFKPSQVFENSTEGIDVSGKGAKYAGFEYASRNLAIGLGLLIAVWTGLPLLIAIVLFIRILIEIQTIIINVAIRKFNEGFITALIFLALEMAVIIILFK